MSDRKGTQMEVPGTPAPINERDAVEDRLNHCVNAIFNLERQLRAARADERLLRRQLAALPREG